MSHLEKASSELAVNPPPAMYSASQQQQPQYSPPQAASPHPQQGYPQQPVYGYAAPVAAAPPPAAPGTSDEMDIDTIAEVSRRPSDGVPRS